MQAMSPQAHRVAFVAVALVILAVAAYTQVTGTAARAEPSALSGTVHNYAPFSIAAVTVNGRWAGGGNAAVRAGEANSSGTVCCIEIDRQAATVAVDVTPATGAPFATHAKVLQPWPEMASYAIVHVLPNRKAVVEIVASDWFERPERLASLQAAADQ